MGIIKTIYPNKNSIVIIWKINESLSTLQNMTKEKSKRLPPSGLLAYRRGHSDWVDSLK